VLRPNLLAVTKNRVSVMTLPDVPGPRDPECLRGRAQKYREMATTATDPNTVDDLLRLAERFEVLALTLERDGPD
jgi:hypothetical protein